jgi:hypothetical protein
MSEHTHQKKGVTHQTHLCLSRSALSSHCFLVSGSRPFHATETILAISVVYSCHVTTHERIRYEWATVLHLFDKLTLTVFPSSKRSFLITLCFSAEKIMKADLKRFGASGAFLYFVAFLALSFFDVFIVL